MKKILLGVILVLILNYPNQIRAQGLEAGITINSVFSTITVNHSNWYDLKSGYSSGLFVKYNIADAIGFSIGLNYSQLGAKEIDPYLVYFNNSPLVIDQNRMDFIFNSLEVPVLAHIYVVDLISMKLKVLIGESTTFNQKSYSLSFNDYKPDGFKNLAYQTTDDITDRIEAVSFNGILGFGAEIDADPVAISINLSYNMGLSNMNNVKGNPFFYNNYFALGITAAYKF